ncbi:MULTISPECIES: hypothetical protein [Streptacidiphilus]|uniref:DUF4333 domain-containing protein n=1 Tax=Streptacidiphilus cavernicola TaxID=3342716 RepID=A0ABV6UN67_9ACTN|nr:hypothetical protein [Streptacidiphilus jeojiense]
MAGESVGAGTSRHRRLWAVGVLPAVAAVLLGVWLATDGWARVQDALDGPDASEPSCSWSARVEGADADQAGLIRCYLRALAQHSESGLRAVVPSQDNQGPTGFTAADFTHSRDAAAGPATVTVKPNDSDSADASVTISYIDGAHDQLEIHGANPASAHSWRFVSVGTYPSNPNEPSAAIPSR